MDSRTEKEKKREEKLNGKEKQIIFPFVFLDAERKDQINLVGHKEVDLYVCATTLSFFSLFASPLHKKLFTLFQRTTS